MKKHLIVGLVLATVVFWYGSAIAYDCIDADGDGWYDDFPISLDDMGAFVNGEWEWNQNYFDPVTESGQIAVECNGTTQTFYFYWWNLPAGNPNTDPERWTPKKVIYVDVDMLNYREFADKDPVTHLSFRPWDATLFPIAFWSQNRQVPYGDPVTWGLVWNFHPPDGCICDESGCTPECDNPPTEPKLNVDGDFISTDRLRVVWENKDIEIPGSQIVDMRGSEAINAGYNMGIRFWEDQTGCEWRKCIDGWRQNPDNYYRANWWGQKPISGQLQTFIVYIDDDPYTYTIEGADTDNVPPQIPAVIQERQIVYNKNGKEVKGLSKVVVDVKNITSEYDSLGNLIIQWAEPVIAHSGMELIISLDPTPNAYLWMDCPSQLGTAVIPSEIMDKIKYKSDTGAFRIIYRHRYNTYQKMINPDGTDGIGYPKTGKNYHVRGYSDPVVVSLE